MANNSLNNARAAKKDEFYTQFYDIELEMEAYLDYNPDVFRGKTVLLPCDDPEWSNFTRYFAQNFEDLGLKKLISTSYAPESMTFKKGVQLSLFETLSPKYDADKTRTHGRIDFTRHKPYRGQWCITDKNDAMIAEEALRAATFLANEIAKKGYEEVGFDAYHDYPTPKGGKKIPLIVQNGDSYTIQSTLTPALVETEYVAPVFNVFLNLKSSNCAP
jgi:hypothetical protein